MTNSTPLSASVRILELDLSGVLQEIFDTKKVPDGKLITAPRQGGLSANIIKALEQRTSHPLNPQDLFAKHTLTLFSREKKIEYETSVDGRNVFVVLDNALPDKASVSSEFYLAASVLSTDNYLMLAQMAGQAAKKNGAAQVHLIMPTFAYARQDKDHGRRGPTTAAVIAQNLEPYFDSVTSVHLHSQAIKGMFRNITLNEISPCEIYTPSFVCRDPQTLTPIDPEDLTLLGVNMLFDQLCIVSPDAGGSKNARDLAKYAKTFAACLLNTKEDKVHDIAMAQIDKRRSGSKVDVMNVLGERYVANRHAIIVDDMGDSFGTATQAANALEKAQAKSIAFWGTHGYFSGPAVERLAKAPITEVHITNGLALPSDVIANPQTKIIDIAPVLAQFIIDKTTRPDDNLYVDTRHIESDDHRRSLMGRFVSAMMKYPFTK